MARYDRPGGGDGLEAIGIVPTPSQMSWGGSAPASGTEDASVALGGRVQGGTVGNSAVPDAPGVSLAMTPVVQVGPRDTLTGHQSGLYSGPQSNLGGATGDQVGSTGFPGSDPQASANPYKHYGPASGG